MQEDIAGRWRSLTGRSHAGLALLAAILAVGGAARIWLACVDDGIYWPDEVYQSIEPAHRLVFGPGLVSWEYGLGARTWALPGLVAALLWLCQAVGLDDPRQYLLATRFAMCAIAMATAWAGYLLGRRFGAEPLFAACGAAVFALAGPAVYFGPKALSETVSALPIVLGLASALSPHATRRDRIVGAALLCLATIIRLHNAIFCAALLAVWLGERRWRALIDGVVVMAAGAMALGAFDRLTWGEWFQSAVLYLRFTFVMDGGPMTGDSPATYYLQMFARSMPLVAALAVALAIAGAARARSLAFVVAVFLLAHVLTPNKAYRYVIVAIPLMGALAAAGLQAIQGHRSRRAALVTAALLVAVCGWSLATMRTLTFGDIGPYEKTRAAESAFDDVGPVNRLLVIASRQVELCGLRVETHHLTWTGGYSFFHRNVPLYSAAAPDRSSGFYNFIIASTAETAGNPVASDGAFVLRRLGPETCAPDPSYDWKLPGYEAIRQGLGR
jgi:hypothetical protein